jgi:hypothetical protein
VVQVKKKLLQEIEEWISGAIKFVTVDIWRLRLEDLPFGKSFLVKQLRVFLLTLRGFVEDRCFSRASSLTFNTLLSIVPVAAILFGVAKGFGFETKLKRELFDKFSGEAQQEVLLKVFDFAESMLQATKGGVIAGIGLVILFWSVINVLSNIEASFNDIWGIKEGRTWGRKFSDYLAIMILSPLFIMLSSSATVFITAKITLQSFYFFGFEADPLCAPLGPFYNYLRFDAQYQSQSQSRSAGRNYRRYHFSDCPVGLHQFSDRDCTVQCHLRQLRRFTAVSDVGADQLVGGPVRGRAVVCSPEC